MKMTALIWSSLVLVLLVVAVLGWSGFTTKIEAVRDVTRDVVGGSTPDEVLLREIEIELRHRAERLADADVDEDDLDFEVARQEAFLNARRVELKGHEADLEKAAQWLDSNVEEFKVNGELISRERLEKDALKRVSRCQSLSEEIETAEIALVAHQLALDTSRERIDLASSQLQRDWEEFRRLERELKTARTWEGLGSRLAGIEELGMSTDNLSALREDLRKRIRRAKSNSAWSTDGASAGLLDLRETHTSESATAAIDAYFMADSSTSASSGTSPSRTPLLNISN